MTSPSPPRTDLRGCGQRRVAAVGRASAPCSAAPRSPPAASSWGPSPGSLVWGRQQEAMTASVPGPHCPMPGSSFCSLEEAWGSWTTALHYSPRASSPPEPCLPQPSGTETIQDLAASASSSIGLSVGRALGAGYSVAASAPLPQPSVLE